MILVLLGTFQIEFPRPLIAIENALKDGSFNEKIIVQSGHTVFSSTYFEIRPFINPSELVQYYKEAEIIVTHAGEGSILQGVKLGKKLIAIPRLQKYKEHVDDHQLDILNEFAEQGYLIPWNENEDFKTVLDRVRNFNPNPFVSNKQDLEEFLMGYIDKIK